MAENNLAEQKEKLLEILNTMFGYLGLTGSFRIEESEKRLSVKITSDDAGRIIGRKGQTLDSLQLLVNRMMFKGDEKCPLIRLDIDGYASGERTRRTAEGVNGSENGEGGGHPVRERRERRPRFDGEGGERRPVAELEQQALDAAKEVKRWGEPVKLPSMNAHDRRIIHMTLKNDPELTTESEGEGAFKKVVISLKKEANV